MASAIAAFVFYGLAIWEHAHDKPLSAFLLLVITVPLFWLGSLVAWSTVRKELDQLKQRPPSIQIRFKELHRKEIDFKGTYPGGEWKFDVFLCARVDLIEPRQVSIAGYRLELSMSGLPEIPDRKDDLHDWELMIFETTGEGMGWTEHDLHPLPMSLTSGEPVEGWLHFVTRTTRPKFLDESNVWLILETPSGSQYGERSADPLIWNPERRKVSRKVQLATLAD